MAGATLRTEHSSCHLLSQAVNAMINSGVAPNEVIYTSLITCWCMAGRMEDAERVFQVLCPQASPIVLTQFDACLPCLHAPFVSASRFGGPLLV